MSGFGWCGHKGGSIGKRWCGVWEEVWCGVWKEEWKCSFEEKVAWRGGAKGVVGGGKDLPGGPTASSESDHFGKKI